MKDYQRAAWGEGMADKVVRFAMDAVIGGDVALVGEGTHHVEGDFCLRNELVPEVDGERWVSSSKDRYKVSLESLYSAFCFVGPVIKRGHEFVLYVLGNEVLPQAFRSFVVQDLKLDETS